MTHNCEKFNQALHLLNARLELTGAPRFNLVVCGGTALAATGLVPRTTKDVDIVALMDDEGDLLDPAPLPQALVREAHEVALDLGLPQDWLNNGPSSGDGGLFRLGLPDGFVERLICESVGKKTNDWFYQPLRSDPLQTVCSGRSIRQLPCSRPAGTSTYG